MGDTAEAQRIEDVDYPGTGDGRENRSAAATTSNISSLLEIASSITQEQCPLLGVKSLGVDYGLARTGVAVTIGYNPKPLAILSDFVNQTEALCKRVVQYAAMEQVQKIVVGLPLHKNGTLDLQANLTLVFAEELACTVLSELGPNVPVELWDERYSSKEAAARVHSMDPHRTLYGSLDADAACIILEHFYNENGKGRLTVQVSDPLRRESCVAHFAAKQMEETQKRRGALLERERKLQRRRQAIINAQRAEAEVGGHGTGARKTKKKKKRRK